MKICFLTERMRLGFGVDLVVDEQARRLAARGYEVVVLVIHADIDLPERPYQLVVLNRIMAIGDFSSESWMKRALSICRVDADLWILSTPPFYDWARFLDGPIIAVEYGSAPGHMFSKEIGPHLDAMVDSRFTVIYGNLLPFDAIVSISQSIHQWLPQHAHPFSTIIHLGCDHYARTSKERADALRASLGIDPDDCMILWVGRMQLENDEQPYKGFKDLLSLIPLVQPHLPMTKFVLAGRITNTDKHRLQSAGFAVLANLTPEDLACAYSAADVLINLAKWEGFNLALLEASYQCTPVVAFDIGPHSEIVRHNETGILVNSSQSFFKAVINVASDRALREKLAQQAFAFAEKFSWEISVDKLERVIADCMARSPSRKEVLRLRRKTQKNAHAVTQAPVCNGEIVHTRDLLALDGRDFVRAARQILLGEESDDAAEAPWLRTLRRGSRKKAILLDMSDLAKARGTYREFPGLETSLLGAGIVRAFKRLLGRGDFAGTSGVSEWHNLQGDVFVQHAYRVLLGREAAPQEIGPKLDQLRIGRSRQALLAEIRFSDEGRNRPLEDPELVRIFQSESLGQQLSAPDGCLPVYDVSLRLTRLQAFLDNLLRLGRHVSASRWFRLPDAEFVSMAYRVLLCREPADPEIADRVKGLHQGCSRRSMLAEIRFSDEGRDRELNDLDLRRILLPDILARRPPLPPRTPSPPFSTRAREFWVNLLSLRKPPPVSQWFLIGDNDFVHQAFRGLLGREIDPATAAGLREQLSNGRSRQSILAEIRFSSEGSKRKLLDPELRRILFLESLLRSSPIGWIVGAKKAGDDELEDMKRQLRRIESRQRALAVDISSSGTALSGTTHLNHAIGTVLGRLNDLEARIGASSAAPQSAVRAQSVTSLDSPVLPIYEPITLTSAPFRLGASYVALVAPDTALDPAALSRLAETAEATGSDIVLGNEREGLQDPPFQRLRIHGPFSHHAFLRNPDLGCAIAVRSDLLSLLRLPATTALTGTAALQLISVAHTITHLPITLGRRTTSAISANRPVIDEMRSYAGGMQRPVAVELNSNSAGFDIRFPANFKWKAAIIVVTALDDELERSLAVLRSFTPQHQYELTVVRVLHDNDKAGDPKSGNGQIVPTLRSKSRFAQSVNEAIEQAPESCNLIVVMESGVSPTSPDWLERLAESALRFDIGVVAPMTLYPNRSVRHAGLAFGEGDFCAYVSRFAQMDNFVDDRQSVDLDRLRGLREVSAVSGHCMLFRRSVFLDQGQFVPDFNQQVSDVEFCCRLRRAGLSVLLDGRIVMFQDDPQPRWARTVSKGQLAALTAKHGRQFRGEDPFWIPLQRSQIRSIFLPPMKWR